MNAPTMIKQTPNTDRAAFPPCSADAIIEAMPIVTGPAATTALNRIFTVSVSFASVMRLVVSLQVVGSGYRGR